MWYDLPVFGSIGGNLLVIAVLAVFDWLFAPPKARWFAVHAFANLGVVATSLASVYVCAVDPVHAGDSRVYNDRSMFGRQHRVRACASAAPCTERPAACRSASQWPVLIVNAVHVYHMIAFGKLSVNDYFHHLMFIPTVGFFGQYYEWGALRNFLCFFISGLPGGVDYLLLVLVKLGHIDVMAQKRVCAALNT
jgi:hypothetical protein